MQGIFPIRDLTRLTFLGVAVIFLAVSSSLRAQSFSTTIDAAYYGYLDQYSMNTEHGFIGDEACVPTSTTNALTLLQNLNPTVFGTGLSGSTYASWKATDRALINSMGTTAGGGTYFSQLPYGLNDYLNNLPTNYTSKISMSGQFNYVTWTTQSPQPSYITSQAPTAAFIYSALQNLDGVLLSIAYSHGDGTLTSGGHELLANGITWNGTSGSISFIDPLDPSVNYSTSQALDGTYPATGPAMATTGSLTLLTTGDSAGSLLLEYYQYNGDDTTPISDGPFYNEFAVIGNVFALGVFAVPEPSQYGFLVFLTVAGFMAWKRLPVKIFS